MATRAKSTQAKPKSTGSKPRSVIEKSAGAVVFYRGTNIEYLLIYSTYWEFPKGLIDAGEDEETAALREAREETGLAVQFVPGFRQEINYFYRRAGALIRKQVVYFLAEASDQKIKLSWEHKDAKWLSFDAALAELKYENARETLQKANEFLSKTQ